MVAMKCILYQNIFGAKTSWFDHSTSRTWLPMKQEQSLSSTSFPGLKNRFRLPSSPSSISEGNNFFSFFFSFLFSFVFLFSFIFLFFILFSFVYSLPASFLLFPCRYFSRSSLSVLLSATCSIRTVLSFVLLEQFCLLLY